VPHLSNGELVISERGLDPALNDVYKDMLVFVPANKSEVRPTCSTPPYIQRRSLAPLAANPHPRLGSLCNLGCFVDEACPT
jgi:hypothetical protein